MERGGGERRHDPKVTGGMSSMIPSKEQLLRGSARDLVQQLAVFTPRARALISAGGIEGEGVRLLLALCADIETTAKTVREDIDATKEKTIVISERRAASYNVG